MPSTYTLARDYLQRAHAVLKHNDERTAELRQIIQQTIRLLDHIEPPVPQHESSNVISYSAFRDQKDA
jgi:hypothetical protein